MTPSATNPAVGPPSRTAIGFISQGDGYNVYGNGTDAASGVAALTADVSSLTTGATSVLLTSAGGPWTIDSTTYAYRSALQTAQSPLSGSKVFAVSAIDKAGNMSSAVSGSVALDNAAPTISSVLLANGNGTAGRADNGDQVIVTRRPSWNGLWNETVFSGDADGTWSARKC
jgi:microcompartment protein CcmK/EutM